MGEVALKRLAPNSPQCGTTIGPWVWSYFRFLGEGGYSYERGTLFSRALWVFGHLRHLKVQGSELQTVDAFT